MRINQNEAITLAIAGAEVTIPASVIANLWIGQLASNSVQHAGEAIKSDMQFQIPVADGEQWLGVVVSADGRHRHHVILLPGESDKAGWQDQMNWAKSIGGDLPDRVEGALLYSLHASGHLKDEFKPEWYWLSEQHVSDSDYAWLQGFYGGDQNYGSPSSKFRARAVRRLPI